jgi:hypothetical protein
MAPAKSTSPLPYPFGVARQVTVCPVRAVWRHAEQLIGTHVRRKPVRKPLPANTPRVALEILPPEVERDGPAAFERIEVESREVRERRPASTVVVAVWYPKFVRKDRDRKLASEILVGETVGPCVAVEPAGDHRWQEEVDPSSGTAVATHGPPRGICGAIAVAAECRARSGNPPPRTGSTRSWRGPSGSM